MKTRWLATTLLLLLPAAAVAQQLEYGMRSGVAWTDNVFGTSDESSQPRQDDWSLRLSPWGRLSDPDGDVTWSLRYQPSYEYYIDESDLRGFDHNANGELSWRVGDRTTLFATEEYAQYQSLVRFNENTGSPTDPAVLRGKNESISSNVLSAGVRHFLTPRDVFLLSGSYTFRAYSAGGSTDNWTTRLGTSYEHNLSERTTIGATGSWIQQTFQRDLGHDIVTDYYNISGVLRHSFSRTLSVELSAGPTLIDGNQDAVSFSPQFGAVVLGGGGEAINANDCPLLIPASEGGVFQPDPDLPNYNPHVSTLNFGSCATSSDNFVTSGELALLGYPGGGDPLVPGDSTNQNVKLTDFDHPYQENSSGDLVPFDDSSIGSSEFTYFARAALIKDWELWHAELVYERSNDDSGSFGASSVQDSFEATVRWNPAPLWSVELVGAYTMIDQASDVTIPTSLVLENGPVPAGVDGVSQVATVQRLVVQADSNAVSYTTESIALTATRRLTQTSSAFASLYYYQQDQHLDLPKDFSFLPSASSGGGSSNALTHTLTLWLGIDWQFETLKF